jgi:hypothetical protein
LTSNIILNDATTYIGDKDSAVIRIGGEGQHVDPEVGDPRVFAVTGTFRFPIVAGLNDSEEAVEGFNLDRHHAGSAGRGHDRGEDRREVRSRGRQRLTAHLKVKLNKILKSFYLLNHCFLFEYLSTCVVAFCAT